MLYEFIARIQPVAAWFFNLFDSRLILCCMTPWICNQCMRLARSCPGHGSGLRKEVERALQQLDCVARMQCSSMLSSRFPLSQATGDAEEVDRWGEKTKHRLISYFVSNKSAQNIVIGSCKSRLQQVKRWDVFTARRYASAVLGVVILSVRPSVTRVLCD